MAIQPIWTCFFFKLIDLKPFLCQMFSKEQAIQILQNSNNQQECMGFLDTEREVSLRLTQKVILEALLLLKLEKNPLKCFVVI